MIIVNNELNQKWLKKALDCSENVILADGGANRLFKSPYRDNEKVRCIVGDLDSVKPEVKDFYQEKGCKLEQVWDQNRNDF